MNQQQATVLQQLLDKIEQKVSLGNTAKLAVQYIASSSLVDRRSPGQNDSGELSQEHAAASEKAKVESEAIENLFLNQLESDSGLRSFLSDVLHLNIFSSDKRTAAQKKLQGDASTELMATLTVCRDLALGIGSADHQEKVSKYWYRSICRLLATRMIARRVEKNELGVFSCSSLLFDYGQMALLAQLGNHYVGFLDKAKAQGVSVLALEMASLGFDHRVIGAKLLLRWNGSSLAADGILAAHHDPEHVKSSVPVATKVVQGADRIADFVEGTEKPCEGEQRRLLEGFSKNLGLGSNVIRSVVESVDQPCREILQALQIEGPGEPRKVTISIVDPPSKTKKPAAKKGATSPKQESAEQKPENKTGSVAVKKTDAQPASKSEPTVQRVERRLSELDQQFQEWQKEDEAHQQKEEENAGQDPAVAEVQKWTGNRVFTGNVAAALRMCRDHKKEIGLVLVEIDRFDDLLFAESIEDIYQIQKKVRGALEALASKEGGTVAEISDERYAVIFPDRDLTETARFGKTALQLLRSWSAMRIKQGHSPVTFSIGSVAAGNISDRVKPLHLIQGAQRCLGAVKLQAGNGHKSISLIS